MPVVSPSHTSPADTDGGALTQPAVAASVGGCELRTTWLLVLSIGTFALGIDGFVLSGLLPQVSADLHVSVGTAGQLTTLFALVYAVGSPIIGALTGKWERRTVLRAGMGLFVVGAGLQALGPSFPVVAAGRVLAALGAAGYRANAYSTAALLSDDRRRARSLAVVAGGSSVALVAGLPFGVLVGQALGWRAAMWLIVALASVSGLAVGLLPVVHAPRTRLRERLAVLGDRRVAGLLVTTLSVLVPSFLIIAYIPAVLAASGSLVVVAMVALGCGQVLGTTLVARLVNRRGARAALITGALAITSSVAALGVVRGIPAAALICLATLGSVPARSSCPSRSDCLTSYPSRPRLSWASTARPSTWPAPAAPVSAVST